VKIAQITDLHLDDFLADYYKVDTRGNVLKVLEAIRARGVSELVLTGDFGVPESHGWLFEILTNQGFSYSILLGNHDRVETFADLDFARPLLRTDGLYYVKTMGGVQTVFLDSSLGEIGPLQLKWLPQEVTSQAGRLAVFVHHPILDCGGTVMDLQHSLKNRDTVRDLLLASGRPVSVFCGHYHNVYEVTEGTITQSVTPSTLLQFKGYSDKVEPDNRLIAYRQIELSASAVESVVMPV
jgi:3',5'-cyclic-AMP phosphodiesterase